MKQMMIAILAALVSVAPAQGKYTPKVRVGDELKNEVREGRMDLKRLNMKT